ncbi:MAG: endonuclease III [Candidatus Omnitrophota bacterium]
MKESAESKKKRVKKIIAKLRNVYPEARCALSFSNSFQLLVATILSAQCTDKRVNLVTPPLFKKYRQVQDFAAAEARELERDIRSTGFYKNKAKNIIGAAKGIVERFGGEVPEKMEDLTSLPGVGRKTANVVRGNAFGIPGLTVDTHMIRLNRLLGLTLHEDPVKIELDLMKLVPPAAWTEYSHLIIFHGRARCPARRSDCPHCEILRWCPAGQRNTRS